MIKHKYLTAMLLLIIAFCAVSAVNAEDINGTCEIISEDADIIEETVNIADTSTEPTESSQSIESDEILTVDDTQSDEKLELISDEKDEPALKSDKPDTPALTSTNKEVLSDSDKEFKITYLKQTGKYANDKKVYFKVTDKSNGKAVSKATIWYEIYRSNGDTEDFGTVDTNSKGISYVDFSGHTAHTGKFYITLKYFDWKNDKYNVECDNIKINNVKIVKNTVKIKAPKKAVIFKSGKTYKFRTLNRNNKPVPYVALKFKINTGKAWKTIDVISNEKGIATYKIPKKLGAGIHKVKVSVHDPQFKGKTASSYIKIQKRVSINAKSSSTFLGGLLDVFVKDKSTKKLTNGIKVKMKIYTGSKCKTLKFVTGKDEDTKKNGYFGYATNMLSAGKHKVKIIIDTPKYKGSKTTSLRISKESKYYPKWHAKASNGKVRYSKGFYKIMGY